MDFWRILKLFQLSVEAQQTSSPIVAWGAVTLILAVAIWLHAGAECSKFLNNLNNGQGSANKDGFSKIFVIDRSRRDLSSLRRQMIRKLQPGRTSQAQRQAQVS